MRFLAMTPLLLGLLAQGAPASEAADEALDDETPARAFIERSLVLAPEMVGGFQLVGMEDYPGSPASGIGIRYLHPEFSTVRLDLFVYPAGRVDRDQALAYGMAEVTRQLKDQAAVGRYADLELDEVRAFDLRRVESDGALRPPAKSKRRSRDRTIAALQELTAGADPDNGQVMDIRLSVDGRPLDSRAFLFYRGLYLYKGRITASGLEMPGDTFERFSQHAMATLVPAIEVRSTGGCSAQNVYVDPEQDGEEGKDAFQRAFLAASIRASHENCGVKLDESVPEGMRALPLAYDPGMWGE